VKDVAIVGGGLAGLLAGVELQRRGARPLVLEAGKEPGGVARSILSNGYLLEPAAGSLLLPSADLSPILDAAGIEMTPARSEARTRYVYDRGELFALRESPATLFTRVVSWRAKFRAIREPWIKKPAPDGEESIYDFLTRRFGPEVGRLGADLMAHGVFAGDPQRLSVQAAFPRIVRLEEEAGSIVRGGLRRMRSRPKGTPRASVHVAEEGMRSVAAGLAAYLGDRFVPDATVTSIKSGDGSWQVRWNDGAETFDAVIVALAPPQAAELVPDTVAGLLSDRPEAPVAVVGLGGPSASLPLPAGFGALMGPQSGIRALGILFESQYGPGRAAGGRELAKGIYGGAADPEVLTRTDDELVALMTEELGKVLGTTVRPDWDHVSRSSIPQYPLGHAAWLDTLDEALSGHPGLHLAGWGYRGIGVSTLGSEAVRIADEIVGMS
jgi:oxygen-dependent protoporphyrinogen oxidase